MYDMEEFLSKNGSVTILLFCFLLTLNIVFHILGFWNSYPEYSRKKEKCIRKEPDKFQETNKKKQARDIYTFFLCLYQY